MKVLLVLPEINSGCQWNVGLAYLAAVLKRGGHSVGLFEVNDWAADLPRFLAVIKNQQPSLVGLTANSHQFVYVKELAREIKKTADVFIAVGGVHAILKPESFVDETAIDAICVGEGEASFLELADRLAGGREYFDVKNFWFRKGKEMVKNELAPLAGDLDSLPMPDRTIFRYFAEPGKKTPRFIFSRGCPFECTYCCNHALKKIYKGPGGYVRWRSVELALREIEQLKSRYDFNYFKLDDDTFSLNKIWLKEFCEKLIKKNWGLTFECNIRPGTIDEEGTELLKEAGCRMVKIGIEAGNSDLRRRVLSRYFSDEDIIKTFALAKRFGIKTFSFNMIGVPEETSATIADTVKLNQEIRPDFMQVTAFYPYPLTVLGELCSAKGYIGGDSEDSYMEKSALTLPTISRREIERAVRNFKFNVYWAYNKKKALAEIGERLKKRVIKNPVLHQLAKWGYRGARKLSAILRHN
ncbi:MAG: radical SAM protein [Candidatus Portnoybacteria bacterium]|nr:radical SAM protein [Candidatus Portnoybacteria bacterium]MDD4982490.1 radical SAM protein [Candidatus Portnoybacteria bacterium]